MSCIQCQVPGQPLSLCGNKTECTFCGCLFRKTFNMSSLADIMKYRSFDNAYVFLEHVQLIPVQVWMKQERKEFIPQLLFLYSVCSGQFPEQLKEVQDIFFQDIDSYCPVIAWDHWLASVCLALSRDQFWTLLQAMERNEYDFIICDVLHNIPLQPKFFQGADKEQFLSFLDRIGYKERNPVNHEYIRSHFQSLTEK